MTSFAQADNFFSIQYFNIYCLDTLILLTSVTSFMLSSDPWWYEKSLYRGREPGA